MVMPVERVRFMMWKVVITREISIKIVCKELGYINMPMDHFMRVIFNAIILG